MQCARPPLQANTSHLKHKFLQPKQDSTTAARKRCRHSTRLAAIQPLLEVAGADPALLQDIIVGGAIASAVGFSLYNGLKGEPEICPSCQGSGGVKCFACEGSGKMAGVPVTASRRPLIGSQRDPRTCSVCYGSGLLRCKSCAGTGYINRM